MPDKKPQVLTAKRALAMRVLVVARFDVDVGDWAAYCDAVPGMNHNHEWQHVRDCGDKMMEEVAEILFRNELGRINQQLKARGDDPLVYRQ